MRNNGEVDAANSRSSMVQVAAAMAENAEMQCRVNEALIARLSALEGRIKETNASLNRAMQKQSSRTTSIYPGFDISGDDTLLDVGCGLGDICVNAGTVGAAVIAIDVVESTLRHVEKRMVAVPARSFRGYVSDCMPMPLPDGSATAIVAQEVLEHTESPEAFLRELVRVGAPDARYLITVPDAVSESLLRHVAPPDYFSPPNHRNVFSRGDMERMLSASGLQIVHRLAFGFYWSFWWLFEMADRKANERKDRTAPSNSVKRWEEAWAALQTCPGSQQVAAALDQLCPKSAVFICRKG